MYTNEEKNKTLVLRKRGGRRGRGVIYNVLPFVDDTKFSGTNLFCLEKKKMRFFLKVFAKEDHKVGDLFLKRKPLLRSTQPSRRMEIKQTSTSKPGSSVSDFPATRPARSAPCPTPGCSSPSAPSGWNWCGCSELLHRTPGTQRSAFGTGR